MSIFRLEINIVNLIKMWVEIVFEIPISKQLQGKLEFYSRKRYFIECQSNIGNVFPQRFRSIFDEMGILLKRWASVSRTRGRE